jgi:hypothetical protein
VASEPSGSNRELPNLRVRIVASPVADDAGDVDRIVDGHFGVRTEPSNDFVHGVTSVCIVEGWVLHPSHDPRVEPFGLRQNRAARMTDANVLQLLTIAGPPNR